jgi:hypothetical protein
MNNKITFNNGSKITTIPTENSVRSKGYHYEMDSEDYPTISMEDYIQSKDDALQTIIDYGFDYDGYNQAENLKSLIDKLVEIARIGLKKSI